MKFKLLYYETKNIQFFSQNPFLRVFEHLLFMKFSSLSHVHDISFSTKYSRSCLQILICDNEQLGGVGPTSTISFFSFLFSYSFVSKKSLLCCIYYFSEHYLFLQHIFGYPLWFGYVAQVHDSSLECQCDAIRKQWNCYEVEVDENEVLS